MTSTSSATDSDVSRELAGDALHAALNRFAREQPAHTPIASSRQLAEQYEVSIGTVRRTLQRLVDEGAIYAEERRGYFVADQTATDLGTLVYLDNWEAPERPFVMRLLRGIVGEADRLGYALEVRPYRVALPDELARRPEVRGLLVPWISGLAEMLLARNPRLRIVSMASPALEARPGAASVEPDWFQAGHLALRWLYGQGIRHAFCMGAPTLLSGCEAIRCENRLGIRLQSSLLAPLEDCTHVVRQLLEDRPAALIVGDDKLTLRLLQALERHDRAYADSLRIVSHANVGEDILPARAAKLLFDGAEMGHATVAALDMLLRNEALPGGRWLVPVRLQPPGHEEGN